MTRLAVAVLFLAGIVSACSKKEVVTSTPAAPQTAATAPEANPASDNAAAQTAPGPVLDTSQLVGDAKAAMAEADAALRQRNYQKAVQTMLAIQQAQLNAQQAEAARQQMIALQRNLANAIDSGDQNAKAAAVMLSAGRHR